MFLADSGRGWLRPPRPPPPFFNVFLFLSSPVADTPAVYSILFHIDPDSAIFQHLIFLLGGMKLTIPPTMRLVLSFWEAMIATFTTLLLHADTPLPYHSTALPPPRISKNPAARGAQMWRETTSQLREAADLFRRAADHGIADASYQLGRLYQQGLGIPLDPVAAFENFLAAADGVVVHPTAGKG